MSRPLVIFDLDGTLFASDTVWVEAIQKAQQDIGLPVSDPGVITSCFGASVEVFLPRLAPGISKESYDRFRQIIRDYGEPQISKEGKLYDGVEEMLAHLRVMGYPLALCTNSSMEYAEHILATFRLRALFEHVVSTREANSKERQVANLARNYPSAVVVGDRDFDFLAAQANRFASIGAAYGFGGNEVKLATFVAERVSDILTYVMLADIFAAIEEKIRSKSARLIGVNGIDTSGKTIFASEFVAYLSARGYKAALVGLDDFHNPSSIRNQGRDPIQSYFDNAFNLELLERELLEPISRAQAIDTQLTLLDVETDEFTNRRRYSIDPDTIVILEGVLLFRAPLERYFDLRVFLDVPFDEVLMRANQRDVPRFGPGFLERYRTRYIPLQKRYLAEHTPRERSDIVVDNTDFTRPIISI